LKTFLASLVTALFGQLDQSLAVGKAFEAFGRVLVQDSTSERLPKHLAALFPGAGNQHGHDYAILKIQWITDLKSSAVEHVSISGFTRNDQAAAPLLQLSLLTKLLFCALVCHFTDLLELACAPDVHVSLLRVGRILGQFGCWFSATVLGISVARWLEFNLARHAFYERRQDRSNYYELLSQAGRPLA